MTLVNPLSGEVLDPDDLHMLEHAEEDLSRHLRDVGPLYGVRNDLRARIAELRGKPTLPRARDRSEVQSRVSTCPRCMAKS